jgi:hypothetical protein
VYLGSIVTLCTSSVNCPPNWHDRYDHYNGFDVAPAQRRVQNERYPPFIGFDELSMSTAVAATWSTRTRVLDSWREMFAIDLRALAVVRMGAALILLWDLAFRARDLTAHYTDDGILPRAARLQLSWDFCEPWWLSLHMLSGSWWWNATLFATAALAALALLCGVRTKLALAVSWLLLYSLQARFPMLLQGGDALLRCLLFWLWFLPLDAYSCHRNAAASPNKSLSSMSTVAIILQLLCMYLFTALLKSSPLWTTNFHATYYALQIDHFTKPGGYALLAYPILLQGVTASALVLEFIGPLLLLVPVGNRFARVIVPLLFIVFHLGLVVCLDLGTFPWICMLYWLLVLPTAVWDAAERGWGWLRGQPKLPALRNPPAQPSSHSVMLNAVAAFLIMYVVLMNVARLRNPLATVGNFPMNLLGKVTGLEQYWNMFSPGPYQYGSWLRVEGVLADGTLVNLREPTHPLDDVKPRNVSATYPTQYWRRCFVTAYEFEDAVQQTALLNYYVKQWNQTHAPTQQLVAARLVHMVQPTPEPGSGERYPIERRVLQTIENETLSTPSLNHSQSN